MLLRVLELAVVGIIMFGFVTELVIPFFKGTLYFPSFRKKRSEVQGRLTNTREEVEISEIERKITETKAGFKERQGEDSKKARRSKK